MAKTATELLLKGVEMATNNGDRTEEIPDDAVAAGVWLHSVAAVCSRGVSHCSSCAIGYSLNNAKRID